MSANLKKVHNDLNKFYKSKNVNDLEELKKHLDLAKNAIGMSLDSADVKLNQQRWVPYMPPHFCRPELHYDYTH